MLVAFIVCLAGLVVVIVALARDEPPVRRAQRDTPPTLAEAPRLDFPLTSPGYDPAAVEAYLEAVAHALADLLAVAPPEVVERARRLGLLGPDEEPADAGAPVEEPVQAPASAQARSSTLDGADPGARPTEDNEALRAEAALVVIEARALS
ncbi:MAG: hypothetical protein ACRDZ4_17245 [Egibacteraceae bacterium]